MKVLERTTYGAGLSHATASFIGATSLRSKPAYCRAARAFFKTGTDCVSPFSIKSLAMLPKAFAQSPKVPSDFRDSLDQFSDIQADGTLIFILDSLGVLKPAQSTGPKAYWLSFFEG